MSTGTMHRPAMPAHDNARLLSLDAMRGLAALAVILWHFEFIGPFARSGYLAVDFFFMMSGVVMARAYRSRLAGGLTMSGFLLERLIRLYPLYILGIVIGVARLAGQIVAGHPLRMTWPELGVSALFNLLMLPSPATHILMPVNIPAWSLFFELVVNLAWAGVLIKLSRRMLALYVVVLGTALAAAVVAEGSAQGGWVWPEFHVGLLRSFFGFGVGLLLAGAAVPARARASNGSVLAAVVLCALFVVDVAPPYRPFWDLLVILCAFPVIVHVGMVLDPPPALQRAATALGDMSYPLYVLHFAPVFTLSYLARKIDVSPAIWMPLFLLGLCAVSLYLARTYDPALRRMLRSAFVGGRVRAGSLA